ncbi:sensor histidine kinase [Halobacterium wangiae]|uniref:sensor histidine kinase n=1 Tax=Halobacterium wangiae TaxID=2902623 RepID=UPI001E3FBFDB|nr:sensor histidine kinase [Halobacterium wangiae]
MASVDPQLAVYVAVFATAAVVCAVSLRRVSRIDTPDTRRGFAALLATSGGWAAVQVGFLLAPGAELKEAFHVVGLVVGFSTVGAWLYFCSAYSGRTLHRDPRYRAAAVAVFAVVTLVKVTNPFHQAYFTTTFATTPFPHVVVHSQTPHWVVMGLSYSLAAVGYFMLLELFDRTSLDTRPLTALAALTALPVGFNVVGYATPWLVDMTYEPIGVAAFAVGVLYVFAERFQTIRLTGSVDDPVVFVDDEGHVKDHNRKAEELFPALEGDVTGAPLSAVLPRVAAAIDTDEAVLELDVAGERRYFLVAANPFTVGPRRFGEMVLFSDVTRSERHRRELERQNERLGQFAGIISHDLRNPLNVAAGHVELAREECASEHLDTVANAHERMEALIEDVLALARQGDTIGETESCDLRDLAETSWRNVETVDATLAVASDLRLDADPDRTVQLLENLFRNAIEHAGDDVTVTVGALDDDRGFYVEDDGPGIPAADRESVFEPGHTTTDHGTGFGLAIVAEIADAHGWRVAAVEREAGGARFEVTGVQAAIGAPQNA